MGEYLSSPKTEKDKVDGENLRLKYGACGMQGWRKNMEDTHLTELDIAPDMSVFGVFDGHGGQEVAIYVREHFVDVLKNASGFRTGDYEKSLKETFLKLDIMMETPEGKRELIEISSSIEKKPSLFGRGDTEDYAYHVGCTAVVALVTKTDLYVANAGDSRSVLGKKGKTVEMSYDHKPENELERKRIEKASGFVEDNRVNGVLNLSRSLGDLEYKTNKGFKQEDQMITALPEVKIERVTPDMDYLVIACDGIWDCMTSPEVVKYMYDHCGKEKKISDTVATMLDKIIAHDVAASDMAEREDYTPSKEGERAEDASSTENTPLTQISGDVGGRKPKPHRLNETWVFWYLSRVRTEKNTSLPFSERLKVLGEVNTVEDFFQYYCYFKRPAEMPKEIDFHFFRKGEVPMWEHSPNGGCWIVKMKKTDNIDKKWESILFACIGEQFGDPLLIGVVLSLRAKERLIEIWLKDGRNEAVRTAISKKIREILRIDFTNVMIYYKDHKRSIKDNSTMKNAEGFKFVKKNKGGQNFGRGQMGKGRQKKEEEKIVDGLGDEGQGIGNE